VQLFRIAGSNGFLFRGTNAHLLVIGGFTARTAT
jgi:hypothetical protein